MRATPWKGWKNFLSLAPARTSAEDAIKSSVRPVRERSSSDDLVKSTGTVLLSAVLASSETLPQLQRVPHRNSPRIVPYCDSDSQCVVVYDFGCKVVPTVLAGFLISHSIVPRKRSLSSGDEKPGKSSLAARYVRPTRIVQRQ